MTYCIVIYADAESTGTSTEDTGKDKKDTQRQVIDETWTTGQV